MDIPAPHREAQALLQAHEGKLGPCIPVLTAQFVLLQNRQQQLLTLCALTLSITGFSGPKIFASGEISRWSMIIGIGLVLISLGLVLMSSLVFRFATQYLAETEQSTEALARLISYRNKKTQWYRWQLLTIVLGLTGYVVAVIHFLLVSELHQAG